MPVRGVIEAAANWIGEILSRLHDFVTSAGFKDFVRKVVAWIESAVLWAGNALAGLAIATSRLVKTEAFRDGVRLGRDLLILARKRALSGTRWIGSWLCAIASSEHVKTGIETSADLFELCLPKPRQKLIAVASFVVIVLVMVLPGSESERIGTGPETTAIESGPEVTRIESGPEITGIESGMPNFGEIPAGRERKAAFFGYFLPIVDNQNRAIQKTRQRLHDWYQNRDEISAQDAGDISKIADRYRIDDFEIENDKNWEILLNRVDIVPPSLALAQAANESAWGTSRFARKGNNFFGQWCFKKGCGLVPKKRDANKTHEVAAFDSPQESVKMYIRNLNSNSAYKSLRDLRARLRESDKPVTGHALAAGLNRYSERGAEYVSELREMIEYNKLSTYDRF
jgi:Bax protein